jgi:hypothetical protein
VVRMYEVYVLQIEVVATQFNKREEEGKTKGKSERSRPFYKPGAATLIVKGKLGHHPFIRWSSVAASGKEGNHLILLHSGHSQKATIGI